jgi:putative transcriptional regulator
MPFRVAAAVVIAATFLPAQSTRPEDLGRGKLLVTPREAPDPAFAQSVILLVQYDENGAVGLMINHQTTVPISRALSDVKSANRRSDPMFVGGPVQRGSVMALLRSDVPVAETQRVFERLYFALSAHGLEQALATKKPPDELRVYAGYCGWSQGQLEHEVAMGGWYIFDRGADMVFDSNPATLWARLVEKTGLRNASNPPVRRSMSARSTARAARPRGTCAS